jgi:23S rRNA (pseudouridine1915-N3)-methyltransferase
MQLAVIAIGRRGPAWLQQALADYLERLPRDFRIRLIDIAPARRAGNAAAAQRDEARRLRGAVPEDCLCVVLDERGRPIDTKSLARQMRAWRDENRGVAFLIGGADGTDPGLRREADAVWSLSPLTLPHGMAKLVLVEQLYRAWTILSGHPYHRE